jgi:hypothetical protein
MQLNDYVKECDAFLDSNHLWGIMYLLVWAGMETATLAQQRNVEKPTICRNPEA